MHYLFLTRKGFMEFLETDEAEREYTINMVKEFLKGFPDTCPFAWHTNDGYSPRNSTIIPDFDDTAFVWETQEKVKAKYPEYFI